MPICSCKKVFEVPKEKYIYNWEYRYCCEECWRNSIEYRFRKNTFMKIFNSLSPTYIQHFIEEELKGMPLDYTDEVYAWAEEYLQNLTGQV